MRLSGPRSWSSRLATAVDVFVAAWLLAMLGLGFAARSQIDQLAGTASALTEIARDENSLAVALEPLKTVGVASDVITSTQQELLRASADTARDAGSMRASLDALGVIALAIVALVAVFPVLAIYVPMRLAGLMAARGTRRRTVAT
jgi:hypothetical protein